MKLIIFRVGPARPDISRRLVELYKRNSSIMLSSPAIGTASMIELTEGATEQDVRDLYLELAPYDFVYIGRVTHEHGTVASLTPPERVTPEQELDNLIVLAHRNGYDSLTPEQKARMDELLSGS